LPKHHPLIIRNIFIHFLAISFTSIFNFFFLTEAAQYECSYRRTAHHAAGSLTLNECCGRWLQVQKDTGLSVVLELFMSRRVSSLPIVDNSGRFINVVAKADVMVSVDPLYSIGSWVALLGRVSRTECNGAFCRERKCAENRSK